MEHPIVVGVDGSDPSLDAVDWAVDAAARHGHALRTVHGSLWNRYEATTPSASVDRAAGDVMGHDIASVAESRARARRDDVAVSCEVFADDPVDVLVAESDEASMVVVGNRGRGPLMGALLGSTGLGVAARARCPVVVVRGAAANRGTRNGTVLLALDGTPQGLRAAQFAFDDARTRGSDISAVHVRSPERAAPDGQERDLLDEALAAASGTSDVPVRLETLEDSPRHALLAAADEADLLVLGAHRRRSGVPGLQLGLLSHALLSTSPCPVAVVPEA
ncbi:universal stress protein [Streptomyces sp. PT12]|uniref:universal stress protein n=1 Tax=Streptomyces sp. PT12 TaxID=1510197 RepID=UPI00215D13E3|nr:universal stress protein [Streptomyces sp. PT12]